MPFDGMTQKTEVRIIDEMRELLADPEQWHQGGYETILENGHHAYCILGALRAVAHKRNDRLPVVKALAESVPERRFGAQWCIGDFNDAQSTKHSDILALLDRARERLAA